MALALNIRNARAKKNRHFIAGSSQSPLPSPSATRASTTISTPPIAVTMSLAASRAVLRHSKFAIRRAGVRNASTTSEAAGAVKEKAAEASSKASEGLTKVTSSASSAASKVSSSVGEATNATTGRVGGMVGTVQGTWTLSRSIGSWTVRMRGDCTRRRSRMCHGWNSMARSEALRLSNVP